MCKIMDDIVKQEKMESKIDLIKNYAKESHITFLEAMAQLHISQQEQQLIMRYL